MLTLLPPMTSRLCRIDPPIRVRQWAKRSGQAVEMMHNTEHTFTLVLVNWDNRETTWVPLAQLELLVFCPDEVDNEH